MITLVGVLSLIILALFLGITQTAGIGGGVVINVILMIGFHYSSGMAGEYAYVVMIGSSIMEVSKSLLGQWAELDYSLLILSLPLCLSGALWGTILKMYLTEIIKTCLFIILLSILTYKTFVKYVKSLNISEQQQKELQIQQQYIHEKIEYEGHNIFVFGKILGLLFTVTYNIVLLLLRVEVEKHLEIKANSYEYWVCNILHVVFSIFTTCILGYLQYAQEKAKQDSGHKFAENQRYTLEKIIKLVVYVAFAGVAGGGLGIGGAMIYVPIWIEQGIPQNYVVMNSIPLLFISTLSNCAIGYLGNKYELYPTLMFLSTAIFASLVVKTTYDYLVQKFQIHSIILLCLLIKAILTILCYIPYQIVKMVEDPQKFLYATQFK